MTDEYTQKRPCPTCGTMVKKPCPKGEKDAEPKLTAQMIKDAVDACNGYSGGFI
jgi:hypothetical protein